ncbi:MAG: carboxymuconolactone decarboxylase family protein [Cyanobacteria bacterium J06632_22]
MTHPQQTERHFPIHSLDSAPMPSKAVMQWYQEQFGMVPNLIQIMSEAPALLLSYWQTQVNLLEHSTLSKQEINIVQTIVSHENRCQYCVSGHMAFGKDPVFNNTDAQMAAIRNETDFEDAKLNVLRDFTRKVMKNQGRMASSVLQTFLAAGYTRAQALDVVACIAVKAMSNYMNQMVLTPLDIAFESFADDLPYREQRPSIPA